MLMRTLVLVAVVLSLSSVQASTQDKTVMGAGTTSCGKWSEARRIRSVEAATAAQWVAGFLSGSNIESDDADFLKGPDYQGIMAWIDNHCRLNPLDLVVTASFKLRHELITRLQK